MYANIWTPTLSGTKLFVKDPKNLPTYNWPELDQMMDWPLDRKIKLRKIHWKSHNGMSLSSLKFEFNNGIVSTACENERQKDDPFMHHRHRRHNLRSVDIDTEKTITRFSVYVEEGKDTICKMKLMSDEE